MTEINQMPKEVLEEFKGNFIGKWNKSRFNRVRPDHSLEWMNGRGKSGGGIVGITKTSSALSRWALSYIRSHLKIHTQCLYLPTLMP